MTTGQAGAWSGVCVNRQGGMVVPPGHCLLFHSSRALAGGNVREGLPEDGAATPSPPCTFSRATPLVAPAYLVGKLVKRVLQNGWVRLVAGLSWEKREVAARGSEGYGTLAPIRPPRPPTYTPRASKTVGEHLGTLLCCRRCPPTCIPGWLWNLPKGTPCDDGGREAL